MLDRIKSLFADESDASPPADDDERLQLAAAVLLVEAAEMDGDFDDDERAVVKRALVERFDLSGPEADSLIAQAAGHVDEMVEISNWTRTIKNALSHDERVEIVEMLWEVAYADGVLHDYEANLLRRIAGLLYVTDAESGMARKRALEHLDLPPDTQ